MKAIFVSIIAAGILGTTAFAQERRDVKSDKQENGRHERRHGMHRQKDMMKNLNLSDAQKNQFKALREENKAKMEALKKEQNITVREYNERKEAIQREQKAKREAILTNEQKQQLVKDRAAMEEKRKEQQVKKLDKMKTKLGLSDDQAGKLKSLQDKNFAEMKKIRENEALSKEQKKSQMEALKKSAMEERKSILTAEQLKKMENMKQNRKQKHDKKSIK